VTINFRIKKTILLGLTGTAFLLLLRAENTCAQESALNDSLAQPLPGVTILQRKSDRLFRSVPGSLVVVGERQLNRIAPLSGNDVLRKVAGVNLVEEEGAGLRINIGIRGLDPDRSRSVLMLEDGIPVALNPYGEPEMYFTPVIDKMKSVEVLKGSGQILFGPQTIGGVVNYISAEPPKEATGQLRIRAGQNGYFSSYASFGETVGNVGYLVTYLRKQADDMGPTRFEINDFSAKLRIQLKQDASIGFKIGVYDEVSNSTYVGLTQTMYDRGGEDFVRMAPNDFLPVRRYNISLVHEKKFQEKIVLQTTSFAYTTTRDWRRQDFSTNPNAPNRTGVVWGDPTVPGGALYMQQTSGQRNRQFEVAGFEPKITWENIILGKKGTLKAGTRVLFEKAKEQFVTGRKPDAAGGDMRDNEIRSGFAWSNYVQQEIQLLENLQIHAGIRSEFFDYQRRILRGRFRINNINNVVADTNVMASSLTRSLIPGAGLNWKINENVQVFTGVHKGFAPPRTKDAITTAGVAIDLEAELSTNYELGTRFQSGTWLTGELTLFRMDFQNQIIPISQSSGNSNATGLANGGETLHQGVEAAVEMTISDWWKAKNFRVYIGMNATYVESTFQKDRFLEKDGSTINIKNNKLPYAPSWMFIPSISFEWKNKLGFTFYGHHVSQQFADELNTISPDPLGLIGLIPARTLFDATAFYQVNKKIRIHLSAKNLTNERFIASRRPQGIKVGLDRFVTGGIDLKF